MKLLADTEKNKELKGGLHMMHEHKPPIGHIPPHARKAMVHIEFDEEDWTLLKAVFGDEDTAEAAVEIIRDAPPEIQILAIQLINIIKNKEAA